MRRVSRNLEKALDEEIVEAAPRMRRVSRNFRYAELYILTNEPRLA